MGRAAVRKGLSLALTLVMCFSILSVAVTEMSVLYASATIGANVGLAALPASGTVSSGRYVLSSNRTYGSGGNQLTISGTVLIYLPSGVTMTANGYGGSNGDGGGGGQSGHTGNGGGGGAGIVVNSGNTLIITGPNTGGKTVTLKTLGLLTLMAECGLHIPVRDGSHISVFQKVLADIGDEQSIEQSLSTFSAHMRNIVQIVEQCDDETLVLFDELGAGTDPAEGAALAIALIEHCRSMGSRVAATTHYAELKVYAMRTAGVTNASCEFDVETLKPTYKLLIGIPGKSNAFAISQRLGLAKEIIDKAKSTVSQNDRDFEDVLSQLEQQRQQMEQARIEAERLRQQMEQTKQQSDAYYDEIRKQKEKAEQQARKEAQSIIDEARRTANQVYDELKALRKQMHDAADAQGVNERQAALRRALNEAEEGLTPKKAAVERPKPSRAIKAGDTVELLKLGTKATVLKVNPDGSVQLQAGIMKVSAKPDEVYLLENEPTEVKKYIDKTRREFKNQAQSPELDLRGMDALEASAVLTLFLDNAYMANLTQVRIIHGKGTGVLRKTVQDELRKNKHVKQFRLGVYGEGEDGVTIAELK